MRVLFFLFSTPIALVFLLNCEAPLEKEKKQKKGDEFQIYLEDSKYEFFSGGELKETFTADLITMSEQADKLTIRKPVFESFNAQKKLSITAEEAFSDNEKREIIFSGSIQMKENSGLFLETEEFVYSQIDKRVIGNKSFLGQWLGSAFRGQAFNFFLLHRKLEIDQFRLGDFDEDVSLKKKTK